MGSLIPKQQDIQLMSEKRQKNSMAGFIFALTAAALWSANFIIARGLSSEIPPVSLAFYRWFTAVLAIMPFALKQLIEDFRILRKHLPYLCITSFLGISLFNTLIYLAGHSTSAVNLSIIAIMFPIFIILISGIFLKVRISRQQIIGVIIVFSGALLLTAKGRISSLLNLQFAIGDLWMLIATIVFAVFSILLKHKPAGFRLMSFQFSTFILGVLFLFPFFIYERLNSPPVEFNPQILFSILYVGVFASFFAFLLWNRAIAAIGPIKAGIIYNILPLFSAAQASLFLKEEIRPYHGVCLLIIVSGIILANTASRKKQPAS